MSLSRSRFYELSEYVSMYHDWLGSNTYVRKADGFERRDMPTGRLAIKADCPYRWTDWEKTWREDTHGDLLAQVPAIAEVIIRAAPEVAKQAAEGERQRAEWKRQVEEEQRERERQRAVAAAKAELEASRKRLTELIAAWRRGRDLEAFLQAAAAEVAELDPATRGVAEQQLARARAALAPISAVEILRIWSQPAQPAFEVPVPGPR